MESHELTQMKFDMKDMKNDIKNIASSQEMTNEKVSEIHRDLKDFIESSKGEFAGKWTEKVLISVGSAVGLALIGALMALLLNTPK